MHSPTCLDQQIEDVGNAQRSAVQSYIRLIFVHLLKITSVTKPELRAKRHGEIARFHSEMTTRFTNAMRQDIDVQGLWQSAFREARFDLRSYGQDITIPPKSPCPFELDDLMVDEFDSEAALARIEPLIPSRAD